MNWLRLTTPFAVTLLLLCLCSCSANKPVAQDMKASATTGNPKLDFTLVNFTGSSLEAVYLSPSQSSGWQENLIEGSQLQDGDSVTIRFNREEPTTSWDLKIVGVNRYHSELKSLDLSTVSRITLRLKAAPTAVMVAEAE